MAFICDIHPIVNQNDCLTRWIFLLKPVRPDPRLRAFCARATLRKKSRVVRVISKEFLHLVGDITRTRAISHACWSKFARIGVWVRPVHSEQMFSILFFQSNGKKWVNIEIIVLVYQRMKVQLNVNRIFSYTDSFHFTTRQLRRGNVL